VGNDSKSIDLLQMVNEMANDFLRVLDLYRLASDDPEIIESLPLNQLLGSIDDAQAINGEDASEDEQSPSELRSSSRMRSISSHRGGDGEDERELSLGMQPSALSALNDVLLSRQSERERRFEMKHRQQ
jgi:hypothetical protein